MWERRDITLKDVGLLDCHNLLLRCKLAQNTRRQITRGSLMLTSRDPGETCHSSTLNYTFVQLHKSNAHDTRNFRFVWQIQSFIKLSIWQASFLQYLCLYRRPLTQILPRKILFECYFSSSYTLPHLGKYSCAGYGWMVFGVGSLDFATRCGSRR